MPILLRSKDWEHTAERILIATGSKPAALPIAGSDDPRFLTSDQVLDLTQIPLVWQ